MPRGIPNKKATEKDADAPKPGTTRAPGTVTVGCKIPNGLHLDHQGKRVTLNGSNSSSVIGGHGLTRGVDRDWFMSWLKEHMDFAPVKKGLIFAHEDANKTHAEAQEKKAEKTGLEGINTEDKSDSRAAGVETADDE